MTEIIETGIHFKAPENTLGQLELPAIEGALSEKGFSIKNINEFEKDKSALTNNVFAATLVNSEGENISAILKTATAKKEPREIASIGRNNSVGGWMSSRLQNEFRLLSLVHQTGISSPEPILYKRLENGNEIFAETQLIGQQGSNLRFPSVGVDEFRSMERQRGEILAQINAINCSGRAFGTLDDNARHFDSWNAYFDTKVSTTLSLLHGMYPEISTLKRFGELASDENEWQVFVKGIAKLYSSDKVHSLLEKDNTPTISHADYWDGNTVARMTGKNEWKVSVIDFDRGGVEGQSFDLALWLSSKAPAKKQVNPTFAIPDFLDGYKKAGGTVSPEIQEYVALYGLWQYLDFLVIDTIYEQDRTNKSVPEIIRLSNRLKEIVIN